MISPSNDNGNVAKKSPILSPDVRLKGLFAKVVNRRLLKSAIPGQRSLLTPT